MNLLTSKKTILSILLGGLLSTNFAQSISFSKKTTLEGIEEGEVTIADANGDKKPDIFITGENKDSKKIADLYINDGTGLFTLLTGTPFDKVYQSNASFGDVDGDLDMDILVAGSLGNYKYSAKIYENDGNGNYSIKAGNNLKAGWKGDSEFADIDGDKDLDLMIMGYGSGGNYDRLYRNDGNGVFTSITSPFEAGDDAAVKFVDVDGDKDLDFIQTLSNNGNDAKTNLYINNGNGAFSLSAHQNFEHVKFGSIAVGDVDKDKDIDIFISGYRGVERDRVSILYINDGTGIYTASTNSSFPGVRHSDAEFFDADKDGLPELLLTGRDNNDKAISKLYKNNGNGSFSEIASLPFEGLYYSSSEIADLNGDGYDDVVLTGLNRSYSPQTIVYLNESNPCSPKYGTDVVTACGNYTWIDGITYSTNNNSTRHTLIGGAKNGCDSIVTLNLTINQPTQGTDIVTACNAYTWVDGKSYTTNNNAAQHTLVGAAKNGCDSVVTLNLTINQPAQGTDIITACNEYTWIDGKSYTTNNNAAQHTLVGAAKNGCDSVVTLNLTINQPTQGTDIITACNEYTWIDGKSYTTNNNAAQHTLVGAAKNGCDSIVTLNLTIKTINTSLTVSGNILTSNEENAIYQWIDCDDSNLEILNAKQQTFKATSTGNYAVKISTPKCTATSDCSEVTVVTGINDQNILEKITLYPNPSNEKVFIDLKNISNSTIKIFNSKGVLIYENSNYSGGQVDLSHPNGIYFVEIHHQTFIKRFKLIKNSK